MTQAAMTLHYGMRELRALYNKYLGAGLTIAAGLHLLLIGTYFLVNYLTTEEAPVYTMRIMKYTDLGPPPSITNTDIAPQLAVSQAAKPTIGVPVPVPDAEVSDEQTIATQAELSQQVSPITSDLGSTTIEKNIDVSAEEINIDDGPPADFVPFEKGPEIIKQVIPEYPDLARRANLEGKVWVKIWVDKEGKPRKAEVIKSDAEIFNEPAVKAAMQFLFTPAMMNNGPVAVWVTIPFKFNLRGESK